MSRFVQAVRGLVGRWVRVSGWKTAVSPVAWSFALMALAMGAMGVPQQARAQINPSSVASVATYDGGGFWSYYDSTPYVGGVNSGSERYVTYIAFQIPGGRTYTETTLSFFAVDYYGQPVVGASVTNGQGFSSASTSSGATLENGATFGAIDVLQGGSVEVPLNAAALARMNAISAAGGGAFEIGVVSPIGSDYFFELSSLQLSTTSTASVQTVTISALTTTRNEDGPDTIRYRVARSVSSASSLTVNLAYSGAATPGVDYTAGPGSVTIPPGNATVDVVIDPTADTTIEGNETVVITVAPGSGYTVGSPSSASIAIANDDFPNLSIGDVTLNEGASGVTSFTFTVSLSAPAQPEGVLFQIATANGTATSGSDYTARSLSSQTIPGGASTFTYTVDVTGDGAFESDETFFVNVTNPARAIIVDGQGVGTITNDDAAVPLAVNSLSPASGSTAGATSVVLTGTGFTGVTAVSFGATAATSFVVDSTTQITAVAPARAAGAVNVTVTANGATSASAPGNLYSYAAAPTVTALAPTSGPTVGGTSVTITGTNFAGASAVAFGATPATGFTVTSATQITAVAPAGAGTVNVTVTTAGGASATGPASEFTYRAAPTVTALAPTSGPTVGGTSVTISGTNFAGTTAVNFGSTPATDFMVMSNTQIVATAPAGSGTVDVRVTTAGGTSATSAADQFTYQTGTISVVSNATNLAPGSVATVTVTPSFAPPSGSLLVNLSASGSAGGTLSTSTLTFTNANPQTFTFTAGAPSGAKTISYSLSGASGAAYAAPASTGFTVTSGTISVTGAPSTMTAGQVATITVTPSAAPPNGNLVVTLSKSGSGTLSTSSLTFTNATPQTFTFTAAAPAGPVTLSFARSGTDALAYAAPADVNIFVTAPLPTVSSVSPSQGPAAGGAAITITGTGFTGATGVTVAGAPATAVTVVSNTQITATTPAGTMGQASVVVTNAAGSNGANTLYRYLGAPTANDQSRSVAQNTATAITLTGSDPNTPPSTLTYVVATQPQGTLSGAAPNLNYTPPANFTGTDSFTFIVSNGASTSAAATVTLSVLGPPPSISFLGPNSGSEAGGTPVTIFGSGFASATAVTFGANPSTNFAIQGDSQIIATSPAGTGSVSVTVTTPNGTSGGSTYTYVAAPTISSVSPAEGIAHATNRPANVTITGSNFSAGGNTVNFGGSPGTIVSESTTSIVVTPPANATGGLVNVDVVNASFRSGTAVSAYRYILPPVVTVNWSPASINVGQNTRFTVTITNPNAVALNGVRVASSGAATPFYLTAFGNSCSTGNHNASAAYSLNGFTLAAGASCSDTSDQTTATGGVYQFVTNAPTATGTATTSLALSGVAATSNTITVYGTPSISNISPNFGPQAGGQAVTITGTNFTGATAVSIGGRPATNITVVSATSITATTPATPGANLASVAVTGPAGTGARSSFYQYAALPTAPTVTVPTNGGTTALRPTYQGTAPANATVTVYVDGASIGTTAVVGGTWSLQNPTTFGNGETHAVYATASNATQGTSANSATVSFTTDGTPPAPPAVTAPADGSLINDATPTLTGTVEAGAAVEVYVDGTLAGTVARSTTGGGTWSFTTATLAEGVHSVYAIAIDPAGNRSANGATFTFTIDSVLPITPIILSPSTANVIYDDEALLSGSAEAFSEVLVHVDGTLAGNALANSSGAWNYTLVAGTGEVRVNVEARDQAGNLSGQSQPYGYTFDASPLSAPVVATPANGSQTRDLTPTFTGTTAANARVGIATGGVEQASVTADGTGAWSVDLPTQAEGQHTYQVTATRGAFTSPSRNVSLRLDATAPAAPTLTAPADGSVVATATPVVTGTAEADAVVTVLLDGTSVGQTTADGTGAFSLTLSAQSEGSHQLTATATDAAGNVSAGSTATMFTIDATAPATPVILTPVEGSATLNRSVEFSGTAEADATILIVLDGANQTVTATNAGEWSYTATNLTDGAHAFTVQARDAAAFTSPASAPRNFTVDATAPSAPTVASPSDGSVTGDATPTISGTAEAAATVTVTIDGAMAVTVTADGSGVWSFTASALAEGPHTVVTTATDAVGNVSAASATVAFTVDATAPVAPVITAPVNQSLTSNPDGVFSGTAEAGNIVSVSMNGTVFDSSLVDPSGRWSFQLANLRDGTYVLGAQATDGAGNVSPAASVQFTVDATAPAAPVISAPADGSVTDDGTPTISGTADADATVQLSINGAAPVTVTVSSGGWSYTPPSNLPSGQNTVSAVAVDAAGNASPASATVRFTYSPVTITTTSLASGQVGVAYAADVQVSGGSAPYGFAVTAGALPDGLRLSTAGALSGTPTASRTFTFTVTATDANGLSTGQALSVTIAPPAPPVVTDVDDVEVTANPGGADQPTEIDLSRSVRNATRIEIVTPPANGTATVDGFSVQYVPNDGYFGQDSFTYRAIGFEDGAGAAAAPGTGGALGSVSQPATVTIVIPAPTLTLAGGTQPSGQVGVAYSQTLTTSGGTAPYSYAVTGGSLPTGISLASNGTLTGSPTAGGTFSFTVTATDSSTGAGPFSVSAVHEIVVAAPALIITPSALPNATTAQAYSQAFSAAGGVGPYRYAVTAGALPTGLTLSSAGVLSGTPTQGGTFAFTVTATDSSTGAGPYSAVQAVTLTVAASPIAVTPTTLAAGSRGTPYTASVSASGGVASYNYAIASGALPAGLTLSTTGQISGTPTAVGTFAFQVRATDSATGAGPYSGVADVSVTIAAATLTVTPTSLPDVLAGVPYRQQLTATGGQGGYAFAVTTGALPAGLTLSQGGLISGKPTTAGTFAFTVTATDGFGNTGSAALSVVVTGRPDPAADPDVRGLNSAQAEATRRMVGTQIGTFGRRLEQLHGGGQGQNPVSLNLTLDGSAFTPLDESRVPMGELGQTLARSGQGDRDRSGRDELSRMVQAGRGDAPDASTSAAAGQNAAPHAGPARTSGEQSDGLRVWAGGAISLGERDPTTQTAEMSITTSGISVGVDMSVAEGLDVGVGVGFGQENVDVGVEDSRLEADSWVGVAYGSWRPQGDLFLDGMLGYGELGFDTRRRTPVDQSLVFGQRDGTVLFGSLSAGIDRTAGTARWIGYGRVDVLDADLDGYVETGSPLWALSYDARAVQSRQGTLGLRYERSMVRPDGRWTPGARVEWTHEFGDADAQTLRYADWLEGPGFSIGQDGWDRSRLNLGLSLGWTGSNGWAWTTEYEGGFSDGEIMNGLRLKLLKIF